MFQNFFIISHCGKTREVTGSHKVRYFLKIRKLFKYVLERGGHGLLRIFYNVKSDHYSPNDSENKLASETALSTVCGCCTVLHRFSSPPSSVDSSTIRSLAARIAVLQQPK